MIVSTFLVEVASMIVGNGLFASTLKTDLTTRFARGTEVTEGIIVAFGRLREISNQAKLASPTLSRPSGSGEI